MPSDNQVLHRAPALGLALTALLLVACGKQQPETSSGADAFREATIPVPTDPILALGQSVYRDDCANCHDIGKKGAPRTGDPAAWSPRLSQGMDTLITHATQGFLGPAGDEMPARGGNDDLSDEQVAAAVRYITSFVQ